ncbi:MAG: NifB/NifX family molybdenum-iron cluster-binding protein [Promethearchaeota archaeon]
MVEKTIKIAIPSVSSDGLNAQVTRRFGRCPFFTIVSLKNGEIDEVEIIENSGASAMGGAGPMAVQLVVGAGAKAVAGADYGPNASGALSQGGVSSYGYPNDPNITVKGLVELYLQDKLPLITGASSTAHSGMGMGRRQGMGRGQGQGRGRGNF